MPTSFPRVPSRNSRRFSTVHFPPWLSLYSSWIQKKTKKYMKRQLTIPSSPFPPSSLPPSPSSFPPPSPFPSSLPTHPMFLHRDIGEVNKHIIQFTEAGVIPHGAEPTEPKSISAEREGEIDWHTVSSIPWHPTCRLEPRLTVQDKIHDYVIDWHTVTGIPWHPTCCLELRLTVQVKIYGYVLKTVITYFPLQC